MATVRERQRFLRERLSIIREEIERSGREGEVTELAEGLKQGDSLPSYPSDAEFDLLLPTERAAALPAYFLALRTELVFLEGESVEARRSGRLREWLDGPVPELVKFGVAAASLAEFLVVHGWEALRAIGLAYDARTGSLISDESPSEGDII
jgi:hypothetical protein